MTVARRSKLTPVIEAVLLKSLRAGNTRTAAAATAGVDRHTLARWLATKAPFCTAVEKAEAEAEQRAVGQIRSAMRSNWTAAAWWLERRRPKDWGRVDRVEITFREQAQKIADELGLSVDEVIQEAERIVAR